MRLSVGMLRRIIAEEANSVLREGVAPEEIQYTIKRYKANKSAWSYVAKDQFILMSMGKDPEGVRSSRYSDWSDEDFKDVLNVLEPGWEKEAKEWEEEETKQVCSYCHQPLP